MHLSLFFIENKLFKCSFAAAFFGKWWFIWVYCALCLLFRFLQGTGYTWLWMCAHSLFLFSRHHIPTNGVAPLSAYKPTHNPQFLQSLWRRASVRNVSFFTLYGSLFTFSTRMLTLNYLFITRMITDRIGLLSVSLIICVIIVLVIIIFLNCRKWYCK